VAVVGGGGFVGRALLARLALGSPVQQSERVSERVRERVREGVREGVPVEALCVLDLLPPASSCDAVKFYRVDVTEREQASVCVHVCVCACVCMCVRKCVVCVSVWCA
jgi:nucleoside-diphosphate-sugar epimerase